MSCVLCGSALESRGIAGVRPGSVTSDSRPCSLAARISQCARCGHFQKDPDSGERAVIDALYAEYAAHHLSGGREQLAFVPDGAPRPRSQYALARLRDLLPTTGRLLDVGTGAGAILSSANAVLPTWELHAFDVSDRWRTHILEGPQVRAFYSGALDAVPDVPFDLVVLWHVLEHLDDPVEILRQLRGRLAPRGRLLIQVPDLERHAYDLAVIDHISHFSHSHLEALACACGFTVTVDGREWFHNCLTVVLEADGVDRDVALPADTARVQSPVVWLKATVEHFDECRGSNGYAIFGTGMAGIWLAGQLQHRPDYFVDEDSARWGRDVAGVPVVGPAQLPEGMPLVMAFDAATGRRVAERLRGSHVHLSETRFIVPQGPGPL
jgi:SAM-dependent methyltransferase